MTENIEWCRIVDLPREIERRLGIPAAETVVHVPRCVMGEPIERAGLKRIPGLAPAQLWASSEDNLKYRVSGWDDELRQWAFRDMPFADDAPMRKRLVLWMEFLDSNVIVWDWELAQVDWELGTVRNWGGVRSNLEVHWRNAVGWVKGLQKAGIIATPPSTPTDDGDVDPRPIADEGALRLWFRNRVAAWPSGQAYPTEAADVQAAKAVFRPTVDREVFRHVRRIETPATWHKQGGRQ